jgi:hypothetical protein
MGGEGMADISPPSPAEPQPGGEVAAEQPETPPLDIQSGETVHFREHPEEAPGVDERTRRPLDMPDTTARRTPGFADLQPYGPGGMDSMDVPPQARRAEPEEAPSPIGSEPAQSESSAGKDESAAQIVQAIQELQSLGEELKSAVDGVKTAVTQLGQKLENINTVGE